ncbi:MAG TPA: hypothetical protein PLP83_06220, partial [Candidatus Aminicenantes bacterium]|nr:hypothetical protein [Candidatus Aminicenantes bacterium]
LDPPLLLREEAGWANFGAAPETTLPALFGYDPAKYAPLLGALAAGPQRVPAALRLSLGAPSVELDITATDALEAEEAGVPVTVVETRQERSLRTCLLELAFGDLKPGVHTLTISARGKAGAEGNTASTTFVVR